MHDVNYNSDNGIRGLDNNYFYGIRAGDTFLEIVMPIVSEQFLLILFV